MGLIELAAPADLLDFSVSNFVNAVSANCFHSQTVKGESLLKSGVFDDFSFQTKFFLANIKNECHMNIMKFPAISIERRLRL